MSYPQYREKQRIIAQMHYGNLFRDRYIVLRYKKNLQLIKKILNTKKTIRILDAGGYTADNLEFWKQQGIDTSKIEYHVADYDKAIKPIVESRGGILKFYDFNHDDLTKLYSKQHFDLIICTEVLEHLLDPEKQLGFFKILLKKNGHILISLPNENTIFHRIYSLLGLGIDQYPFALYKHLHFPTVKQSHDFLSRNFQITNHLYYFNFSGTGSRMGFIGAILSRIPDVVWQPLVNLFPGLLARGTIFLCKLK